MTRAQLTAAQPTKSKLHEIVLGANDLAASTRERYLRDLDQWIDFAGVEPAGWTRRQAFEFYRGLLQRMLPQSANRLMASVQYASRWWAHLESNDNLDFARVQAARARDKKQQLALDEEAAQRLLAACDTLIHGQRDFAILVVGLETGMRYMSLEGMTVEDTLLAPGPRYPYPAAFVPLKGKDPAWVPLSDTALSALGPWLRFLADHGVSEGPLFRPLASIIGPTGAGIAPEAKKLSKSAFAKLLDARARAAKLGHINIHRLRHTFVTWRTSQGQQPHEIAAVTHHDVTKVVGALGGYIDLREIGGRIRNSTPSWLAELVRNRCSGGTTYVCTHNQTT